jgi:hypothetical protein
MVTYASEHDGGAFHVDNHEDFEQIKKWKPRFYLDWPCITKHDSYSLTKHCTSSKLSGWDLLAETRKYLVCLITFNEKNA